MSPKSADAPAESPPRIAPALHRTALANASAMLLTAAALTLAFAPAGQFYLAWVGLVPYFLMTRNLRSKRAALLWGWAGGTIYYLVNMWWLAAISAPGLIALAVYLGLVWGLAAVILRGCRLLGRWNPATGGTAPPLRPLRCALLIAAMWTALEWLRGTYSPLGTHGLPLFFLGSSQSHLLIGCQIADVAGVFGVSFWVVLANAAVAILWIDRANLHRLRSLIAGVASILIVVMGYGVFRLTQHTTRPGPTVLVVQCNIPQSESGAKGEGPVEIVNFHLRTTEAALAQCERSGRKVDLVVWSETMMPPLNQQTRVYWSGTDYGRFIQETSQRISDLADQYRTSFLVGATYAAGWRWTAEAGGESQQQPDDRRNSAYLYGPTGVMASERYDKIQLLPFGEFVPYRDSIPWLYRTLLSLGPPDMKQYQLVAGASDALTIFHLDRVSAPEADMTGPLVAAKAWSFVVPICFEDLVAPLVDDLMWGADGRRADFIVNITNDGWFAGSERAVHLQAAIFRSIEHRVPAARSVNTGISGFVDSTGRVSDLLAAGGEGWSAKQLQLDDRTTIYSRVGDLFAELCALVTVAIVAYGMSLPFTKG